MSTIRERNPSLIVSPRAYTVREQEHQIRMRNRLNNIYGSGTKTKSYQPTSVVHSITRHSLFMNETQNDQKQEVDVNGSHSMVNLN